MRRHRPAAVGGRTHLRRCASDSDNGWHRRFRLTHEQATRVQAEVVAWRPLLPAAPRRDGAAPRLVKAGTGLFLNEQGALLTDLHVVSACPRLLVSYGNATNEATILTFDVS